MFIYDEYIKLFFRNKQIYNTLQINLQTPKVMYLIYSPIRLSDFIHLKFLSSFLPLFMLLNQLLNFLIMVKYVLY